MKKRIMLLLEVVFFLGIGFAAFFLKSDSSRKITFEECESAGGVAWLVDLNHPDICPSCAEYQQCQMEYNDLHEVCPECYGACQECQDQYSSKVSCPECYGPCQACQNKYLNDFESHEERYNLCPECKVCDVCEEDIVTKKLNCLPCVPVTHARKKTKDTRIYVTFVLRLFRVPNA